MVHVAPPAHGHLYRVILYKIKMYIDGFVSNKKRLIQKIISQLEMFKKRIFLLSPVSIITHWWEKVEAVVRSIKINTQIIL